MGALKNITGVQKLCSIDCRGKFGRSGGFGGIRFGYTWFAYFSEYAGIYSRKYILGKPYLSRGKFWRPPLPDQQTLDMYSNFLKNAWNEYNALSNEEKMVLSKKARRKKMSGPNLFFKMYLTGKSPFY